MLYFDKILFQRTQHCEIVSSDSVFYIKFNYSAYHQDINVENERNIIKQAHSFGSPLKDYTKNIYFANQCRFCVKLIEVTNMR